MNLATNTPTRVIGGDHPFKSCPNRGTILEKQHRLELKDPVRDDSLRD